VEVTTLPLNFLLGAFFSAFSDMPPLLAILALGTPFLLVVMLLPMFLELRRPKDAGPRLVVSNNFLGASSGLLQVEAFGDSDLNEELDFLLVPIVEKVLAFLPNLEAK
jgi:hypothetical protein